MVNWEDFAFGGNITRLSFESEKILFNSTKYWLTTIKQILQDTKYNRSASWSIWRELQGTDKKNSLFNECEYSPSTEKTRTCKLFTKSITPPSIIERGVRLLTEYKLWKGHEWREFFIICRNFIDIIAPELFYGNFTVAKGLLHEFVSQLDNFYEVDT